MPEVTSARVPLTSANVTKCACPACPVQTRSKCASGKMSALSKVLKTNPLPPEEIPGLYCATGVASCKDLDFKQACICASCPVYREYKLKGGKPPLYYCRDGAAVA